MGNPATSPALLLKPANNFLSVAMVLANNLILDVNPVTSPALLLKPANNFLSVAMVPANNLILDVNLVTSPALLLKNRQSKQSYEKQVVSDFYPDASLIPLASVRVEATLYSVCHRFQHCEVLCCQFSGGK